MLAHEQDGKELTKDHGYPLRLVVPGFIGVRNCKWVQKLEISDKEATTCMQQRDYKMIKEEDWTKINWDSYPSLHCNLANSCIAQPLDGQKVDFKDNNGILTLKGWATGNGEKGIPVSRVQISIDNGVTWNDAKIPHQEASSNPKERIFSWALWKFDVNLNTLKSNEYSLSANGN